MDSERDRKIRERAYDLWVEGGRQDGTADNDWARAEREVAAEADLAAGTAGSAKPRKASSSGRAKKAEGVAVEAVASMKAPPDVAAPEQTPKAQRVPTKKAVNAKGSSA